MGGKNNKIRCKFQEHFGFQTVFTCHHHVSNTKKITPDGGPPLVPLGQGLSTVLPVWVWGQSMALLLVASQKRLGVGGSSGTVGSAVPVPRLSSNGSLPSLGSAPATVTSTGPFAVDTVVVTKEVVLGIDDETEKSSVVGTRMREERSC